MGKTAQLTMDPHKKTGTPAMHAHTCEPAPRNAGGEESAERQGRCKWGQWRLA
jgi:hypothetical protein